MSLQEIIIQSDTDILPTPITVGSIVCITTTAIKNGILLKTPEVYNELANKVHNSNSYSHAICISVVPFIIVSEYAEMVWRNHDINNFVHFANVRQDVLTLALTRLTR